MQLNFSRQRGNDAFSAYLKTLRFAEEDYLSNLFSCKNCAQNPESENRDLDAVEMDGTALGILGTIPQFQKHKKVVLAVSRISDRHYIMRNPKLRAFLDSVFRSARNAGTHNRFHVSVKPLFWRERHELISKLFDPSLPNSDEASIVAKFFCTVFQMHSAEEPREMHSDESSDEDEISKPGKI